MAPPSHIFIIRHGARLDAADKQWHLTSPTPYDSPLTYGGWQQCKALGARIAKILGTSSSAAPRRYKIVIHSSPFLRCMQTSVAIAAGISQPPVPSTLNGNGNSADNAVILPVRRDPFKKTLLRLDSFLGEWMNPDYFERITPPPSSNLMLASAKAELLRKENYDFLPHTTTSPHTHKHKNSSGALWSGGAAALSTSAPPSGLDKGLDSLTSIERALPSSPPRVSSPRGYMSPSPTYAVGISCPIPDGFVAHARDACVVADYQWDSSRDPLDWGHGGDHGEEWQAMHKRFKRGLQKLIDWYSVAEHPYSPVTVMEGEGSTDDTGVEDDVETVVILVSHGAGCNAMIGAVTGKPVLLDIPISALTVATRKPPTEADAPAPAPDVPSDTIALDQAYEITLLVNTDHYRKTSESSNPPSVRGSPIPAPAFRSRGSSMTAYSRPVIIRPFTYTDGASAQGPYDASAHSASSGLLDSVLHSSMAGTTGNGTNAEYTSKTSPSSAKSAAPVASSRIDIPRAGLWAAPVKNRLMDLEEDDDPDNMFPDFEQKRLGTSLGSSPATTVSTAGFPKSGISMQVSGSLNSLMPAIEIRPDYSGGPEEAISDSPLVALPGPRAGLWEGSPRTETKRRWTVNER